MKAKDVLIKMGACPKAIQWVGDKSVQEAWESCPRGDWMLWFAVKLQADKKKLFLVKSLACYEIIHLMKDQRSRDAVLAASLYGKGRIPKEELEKAAIDADAAVDVLSNNYAAVLSNDYVAAVAASYAASAVDAAEADAADAGIYDDDVSISFDAAVVSDTMLEVAASYAASAVDDVEADAATTYDTFLQRSLSKSAEVCRTILTDEIYQKL